MAESIFEPGTYTQICRRINALQPAAVRQWGTMSSAEMLRHCRAQLEMVLQPAENVRVYPTMLRFAPIRWLALYGPRWPKSAPTAPELDVHKKLTDTGLFEHEKEWLLKQLSVLHHLEQVNAVHPLFGRMGKKDWGRAVWKHLDHHLRQFSA